MLKDKTIVLGMTGSVAVYKCCELIRLLKKAGADVHTIMTESAAEFVTPYLIEELSQNKCITDTFERVATFDVKHISLANRADMFVVAPATANIVGKIANGIADDMLSTTIMATKAKKLIVPAMNPNMYSNPIFKANVKRLQQYEDYIVMDAASGEMACGDVGQGRMPEAKQIFDFIERNIETDRPLKGKRVLVSCGATQEAIDPVRFITNHSSGKMGFAVARAAASLGAEVTIIKGNTTAEIPYGMNIVGVKSALDMFNAFKAHYEESDYIFMAAAVADYTPLKKAENKIKKTDGDMNIELKRTDDILKFLGEHSDGKRKICGFSMETENLLNNSRKKLLSKNVNMIAANSISEAGSGFGTDTNKMILITENENRELPLMSKDDCALEIVKTLIKL
ncbi:MAG: bifunctional phosphopantothenoylcysteine decarboxylase/phosphopantothenate--cysteine ligase CoaBC [Clostridiales bacterium]|nr:bifunctional phosphopantothenoylcysteine decarboxylase/phosphopantothenate--cysteine ligase CoaBC [Clostridiales bacterium]